MKIENIILVLGMYIGTALWVFALGYVYKITKGEIK